MITLLLQRALYPNLSYASTVMLLSDMSLNVTPGPYIDDLAEAA